MENFVILHRQKKAIPVFMEDGFGVLLSWLNPLDSGFQLVPNKGGTGIKIRFPCCHINFFQKCGWHTDIKCNSMYRGFLCFRDFRFLYAFGLGPFFGHFCLCHCFFPFQKCLNKWTQINSTATNIFQHFFIVANRFRNVVLLSQTEGEFQMSKATHIRLKNKVKVRVERYEGGTLVVRNMRGKVLGSYESTDMKKFQERYKSLLANKHRG